MDMYNLDEKARLDVLRLECLKTALLEQDVQNGQAALLPQARKLFDFVTDTEQPELYAVRRMDDADPGDYPALGPLDHLGFNGRQLIWDHKCSAYRFRSKQEAERAIAKYQDELGGVMQPVLLPSHMDLF